MQSTRRRAIWLSLAAVWLTAASAGFLLLALWVMGTTVARQLFVLSAIVAAALVALGIRIIRAISLSGAPEPSTPEGRAIARRFGQVVVVEVVAFAVVNTVCIVMRRPDLIVPLDVVIVGVHFLPLAKIFQVARYYPLGALFTSVALLTMLVFPRHAHVGNAIAWYAVPALGCAPVAWFIAGANLREAWQFVRQSRVESAPA